MDSTEKNRQLPRTYRQVVKRFPRIAAAHEQMGSAAEAAGPLEKRTQVLIKIGICAGAGLENALRSQVRRAVEHGLSREEIEHAIVLGINSIGFPATAAALQWADKALSRSEE
ncbi:MAG: carboxymuconolactone decarboxylase family protein [Spirochaetaceae bacterium]|nr:MAG: carboxymuconolactone decarboxylase family protein [Spirochaetaceae bacterium]